MLFSLDVIEREITADGEGECFDGAYFVARIASAPHFDKCILHYILCLLSVESNPKGSAIEFVF